MNPVYQNVQEVAEVAGVRVTQVRRYTDSLLLFKSLGAWTRRSLVKDMQDLYYVIIRIHCNTSVFTIHFYCMCVCVYIHTHTHKTYIIEEIYVCIYIYIYI